MNAYELATAVKQRARQLGFSRCHIAAVGEAPHADFFSRWLAEGRAGEMAYLARNVEKRRQPALLAGDGQSPFASLLVLAVDYHQFDLPPAVRDDPSRGLIASYAWGDDYHEIIRPLLYELDAYLRSLTGRTTLGKCLVDTGPVLERDWAQAAGVGFTGKNCCTIVPQEGSWQFLAVVLVPERLPPDSPTAHMARGCASPHVGVRTGRDDALPEGALAEGAPAENVLAKGAPVVRLQTCGACTRCLTACPTDAFVGPYDLDPRRCISYWTIEAAGPIPHGLRARFGNRIFGCDICQEVCPYNRRLARLTGERTPLLEGLRAQASRIAPPLLEGFHPDTPYWLDDRAFSDRFVRSPIKRARRGGMLRNVCVALGNWGASEAAPALRLALADPHPIARGHAAWALGQVAAKHPHSAIANVAIDLLADVAAGAAAGAADGGCDESVRAEAAAALAFAMAC